MKNDFNENKSCEFAAASEKDNKLGSNWEANKTKLYILFFAVMGGLASNNILNKPEIGSATKAVAQISLYTYIALAAYCAISPLFPSISKTCKRLGFGGGEGSGDNNKVKPKKLDM